jgi:hypothetical protein
MIPSVIPIKLLISGLKSKGFVTNLVIDEFFFTFDRWKNIPYIIPVKGLISQDGSIDLVRNDKTESFAINIIPTETPVNIFDNTFSGLTSQERVDEVTSVIGVDFLYDAIFDSFDREFKNYWTSQIDAFTQQFNVSNAYRYEGIYNLRLGQGPFEAYISTRTITYNQAGDTTSDTTENTPVFFLHGFGTRASHRMSISAGNPNYISQEIIETTIIINIIWNDNSVDFIEWNKIIYDLFETFLGSPEENTYDHTVKQIELGDVFTVVAPIPQPNFNLSGNFRTELNYSRGVTKFKTFDSMRDVYDLVEIPY